MKLLNQSLVYLAGWLLLIVGIWAVYFYFSILREIKESVDEGLENYKRVIVHKAETDSSLLSKNHFDESFFAIREIGRDEALAAKDRYVDTLLYMQDADDEVPELEPARVLSTAFENNGRYYELKIINSMVEEGDLAEELLREAVWLYLILVASVIVINNLVLQRLWKPFYHLLDRLRNFRLNRPEQLPEVKTNTREFVDLQQSVNTLLTHSLAVFDQQKQFIGNASHELQTPLAVITNKLELMLEKEDLDPATAEDLVQVLHIVERLTRLNRSLLLISRIENKQFFDNQQVSLNRVIQQCLTELDDFAAFKGVAITVHETAELSVKMDPSLANIVVSNLIRNAIFHNVSGGAVRIEIDEQTIAICNTGKPLALDAQHVFSRFYKSDTEQAGTGLGLAIVKAICDLYGMAISYHFRDAKHCFELHFSSI